MKEIKLGIAGLGTVGAGVVDILQRRRQDFQKLYGVDIDIVVIVVRDLSHDRGVAIDSSLLTTDRNALKDVDVVVELIGGDTVAKEIVLKALQNGQHVVTANKALLANHWNEIFREVAKAQVMLKFEAAVAGAIPVIKVVQESLSGNHIESLKGIINGTANYILSEMEQRHEDLAPILKEAQDLGYAEAEPTFDIDGIDVAHKLCILVALAFGLNISLNDFHVEGIRHLQLEDLVHAQKLGYHIKLLAIAKKHGGQIEARVHLALVPDTQVLAAVSGAYNAVDIKGNASGDILLYGQGAGRYPTASAVVGDILDVARVWPEGPTEMPLLDASDKSLMPMGDVQTRYYLRLSVCDCPGVLAQITNIFGQHSIGIASVIQKEWSQGDMIPLVIMTDIAKEANVQNALKEITKLDTVATESVLMRVED